MGKDPYNKPILAKGVTIDEYLANKAKRKLPKKPRVIKTSGNMAMQCLKALFSRLYPSKQKKAWTLQGVWMR